MPHRQTSISRPKLERGLSVEGFGGLVIFRPPLLFGEQSEFRLGERLAAAAMKTITLFMKGPLARYRPIEASAVALAMIAAAKQNPRGTHVFESEQIMNLSVPSHEVAP